MTWRKSKKQQKRAPIIPILVVVLVVVGFGVYFVLNPPFGTKSNALFCGVISYGVFSAITYVGGRSTTANFTETTTTTFTTTTSVAALVGHSFSTGTSVTNSSGFVSYGAETFCTYTKTT
jgi:protein-S-isoprenylcysteine O-methyltransferase Ste14